MKVKVIHTKTPEELTITLSGHETDPTLEKVKQLLTDFQGVIIAKKADRQYRIPLVDIYYLESQDEQTILYTKNDSFIITAKLYEIEQWGDPFIRINKSTIINLHYIQSFKPLLNSKLEAMLENGDLVEVSRLYLPLIKKKLGVNHK